VNHCRDEAARQLREGGSHRAHGVDALLAVVVGTEFEGARDRVGTTGVDWEVGLATKC
jgi:hypothetical protein